MSKKVEEIAKQFTDELFAGDDLTDFDTQAEKNDAYVMCMAFGNHLMEQPLSVRLTTDEKERVREAYKHHLNAIGDCYAHCMVRAELEDIFGKEFFKKGE